MSAGGAEARSATTVPHALCWHTSLQAHHKMLALILSSPSLLPGCHQRAPAAATNDARSVAGFRVSRRSLCFSTLLAIPAAAVADSRFKGLDPNWKPKGLAARRQGGDSAAVAPPEEYDGIGDPGFFQPTSELLYIQNARRELDAVRAKLGASGYKLNEEDRIAIFQLLGFSFKPTRVLMDKMLEPKVRVRVRVSPSPNPNPNPCLLYTSPSPRDQRGSRMPSSA